MTVREIQSAVAHLSPGELREFRQWFEDFEAAVWDRQLEQDVQAGRLDALAAEALEALDGDRCTSL